MPDGAAELRWRYDQLVGVTYGLPDDVVLAWAFASRRREVYRWLLRVMFLKRVEEVRLALEDALLNSPETSSSADAARESTIVG